jgi:stage II sporulation protein D
MKRLGVVLALMILTPGCAPLPPPQTPAPPPAAGTPDEAPPVPAPVPIPVPVPDLPRGEATVSVGLAWDLDTLSIAPLRPLRLEIAGAGGTRPAGTLSRAFKLGVESGSMAMTPADADPGAGDTLVLKSSAGDPRAAALRWNGKSWRGSARIFVNARGRMTLALDLPMETYLLGVLPGEIGALSPQLLEAGRAQAIAARSYTLFYRGRRAAEGFDLYGTVEDQVYVGVEGERPLATRCVEATRGTVGLSSEQPIRANYSSTCAGISSEVWEAWPTAPLPYLDSHPDRAGASGPDFCASSPHYRWREEWTPSELAANIARHGPTLGVALPSAGVGEIVDVRVASRSRSGRVWRLDVETTAGTIGIHAHALRQVLRRPGNPAAILRSNLFKVDVRRDPRTRRALAIVASGGGSGHGVGLCQTGALGMARAGYRGEAILEHYYPGASLRRLY